ncbi:MAG: N-acetylmuramoyl-L-alanine amidase [Pseudomonadota bacterium]|nr:N-acetylmuramoyl-L-alanine amidase [Pseudomonadota bacterium]
MRFRISKGRLTADGKSVDYIPSLYMGGPFSPRIAVMHFTYGGTARSSAEWFRTKRANGSSAHIVIERDGSIIQCVPFDRVAWHAGRSRWKNLVGLNNHSIGIELANWGYLQRAGDGWACYTGTRINEPVVATHKNGNPDGSTRPIGWEAYPEVQIAAAAGVVAALVESYSVNEILGHDDISPTRKWDPGPAFDMATFRARVFGGRGYDGDVRVRVTAADGLNLRSGPASSFAALELLPVGTELEPLSTNGKWIEVSVYGGDGRPRATGWIHSHYVEEV